MKNKLLYILALLLTIETLWFIELGKPDGYQKYAEN